MSSVLEQIKALDAQKAQLLSTAKKEALAVAEKAIADLNSLGFNYRLVQEGAPRTGIRRTGIRKEVLTLIKNSNGMSRSDLLTALDATDKSSQQSVSNALSALKKTGAVRSENGLYRGA